LDILNTALIYTHRYGILIIIAATILILIVGCQSSISTAEANRTPSAIEATGTTLLPQESVATTSPAPTPTLFSASSPITLTFWTVEPVSSLASGEPGNIFQNSLRIFERNNPDIRVNTLVKKASGKGGVLDFLRMAREVAPSILPDVVVIAASDLDQAYSDKLIQPLDGRLDRSIVQDLLPAARRMGAVDDTLAGVPLGIELEHTVYNTRIFTTTPILWTNVLSRNVRYLFPAKGVSGLINDATLAQYFSAGGQFLNDQGKLRVDERALREVLDFYQRARESGTITPVILGAETVEELWPFYLEGQAGVAQISVRQYLTDRELLSASEFAPVLVRDQTDTPVSVIHGWLLVLVTADVRRQDAALRLIESFLSTSNNANWNRANKSIPTRDTSYQQLADTDPYWLFLTDQLNAARPAPRFAGYDRIGRIFQQVIEEVIRGEATSEEATATIIDALTQ
jgi:ABC-type glycerol-3-phosphate transport system substrate-binding protein